MSDADKVHRWLTQAELDDMLRDAWYRGAAAAQREAFKAVRFDSPASAEILAAKSLPEYNETRDDRRRLDGPTWWNDE